MARTTATAFLQLKERLEITTLQGATVATRQQNVRAALERELYVLDSFLTGSYARHTMIAPLSEADIDVFVVLDSRYFEPHGQANLLDRVRRVLLQTYATTPKISRNGQAVTITFNDFVVDVVPAFYRNGGGFLIPNSINKEWINTDPKTHVEVTNTANRADSNLVPTVKMIKGWNKNIGHAFVSFYLELIAIELFKGIAVSDYPIRMRYFFDKGKESGTK